MWFVFTTLNLKHFSINESAHNSVNQLLSWTRDGNILSPRLWLAQHVMGKVCLQNVYLNQEKK